MNRPQALWWKQACSDLEMFNQLRRSGAAQCHQLHYLQMTSEKLSKAYFWRSGHAPPKSHTGLVRFLRALLDRPPKELPRIARVLGFGRPTDLDHWLSRTHTLAYSLQNIAPAEAGNGANPEYPWPHGDPVECPVEYHFPIWNQLFDTAQGRKLIGFIETAIRRFDEFA